MLDKMNHNDETEYCKIPKNSDTPKICCSHPKYEQGGFTAE